MSRKREKENNVIKIITGIVAILILLAIIVFFGLFTRGCSQTVATFYCRYEGKLLIGEEEKLFPREKVTVEVKYLLKFAESNTDYTVKIEPNGEKDFAFQVGETEYRYSDIEDLTGLFTIEKTEGYFTLDLSEMTTMEELLSARYGEAVMTEESIPLNEHYFVLTVTSAKGEKVVIKFGLEGNAVTGIELNPTEIVF